LQSNAKTWIAISHRAEDDLKRTSSQAPMHDGDKGYLAKTEME